MKKNVSFKLISLFTIILFFVLLIYFYLNVVKSSKENVVEATFIETTISEVFNNLNPLNIEEILDLNSSLKIKEEMIYEEIDLEYTTQYINNDSLPSGTIMVTQIGIDGKQDVITIKRYNDETLISEQIVASNVIKASINKIVEIGTGTGKNNYELKKGDVVYSTPNSLPVMQEANNNSEKLFTINKGTEVKVLDVYDNGWSYIFANYRNGYVLSEGLSNINPNKTENNENNQEIEFSKSELLSKLSMNMDVGTPSGLSLEQFKKVLQYNSNDKNGVFTQNTDYFYYAEQEYGINGLFLAAIAIHESGWGTSSIAVNKNNLFGYMAYDNSTYSSAATFSSYSEGIDMVARVLMKYYLNSPGTEIYGGNIADGKYYMGNTISDVNKYYASDYNWANSVYSIMKNLYESL
jgi:beta-N-acetylglucosaminidase